MNSWRPKLMPKQMPKRRRRPIHPNRPGRKSGVMRRKSPCFQAGATLVPAQSRTDDEIWPLPTDRVALFPFRPSRRSLAWNCTVPRVQCFGLMNQSSCKTPSLRPLKLSWNLIGTVIPSKHGGSMLYGVPCYFAKGSPKSLTIPNAK